MKSLEGEYGYNFSDTDEDARVEVAFRWDPKAYHERWLADGSLKDAIRGINVRFDGAWAEVGKDGAVHVDAQYFRFTIRGKELNWDSGYAHPLYKDSANP